MPRPTVEELHFPSLSFAEGGSLVKSFSVVEVKAAIWDCDSYKSPGPDGVNFGFLKEFWEEMQVDIMRFITEFHMNGKLSKGINSTFITLIPISLVGSLYKILAKVLPNRLQLVIGSVISETQTTFVKNRQILDGILIANARKWISESVCTTTASVLVNGSPTEEFPMERGLRQDDPISPFMFLLAAEGLNVMMRAMVQANLYTEYNIGSENSTIVSHLQFADDTILLVVKSWANVHALRGVLSLFEKVYGLKVNFHKSMLVGVNISVSWLTEAAFVLGFQVGKVPFMYLGLPIGGDPCRLAFWEPIVSSIPTRFSRWKNCLFSFGGRLILLKSVLTSLPVYALSFFKAPSGGYSVRDAYSRLTALADGTTTGVPDLIWHKQVPLKVSVLAWRLLRNRLLTKDNLVARNIILPDASFCVGGCGEPKTVNHLFLSCPAFAPLWLLVCSWLHINAVASEVLQVHFTQFVACLGGSRTRGSFLQLFWLCCTSVIWHERNNRVFKAEGTTMQQMLEKVKLCMYWWMKAHYVHLGIHTHRWWSSPLVCLGID
ncbi:hypothetical protein TSUD_18930 [Trifolium subterraneum]|uniref:Reverse transcriptase zinc-binding domain-containing protein n=1 Tax=Trifolium subterraneum TaxID=3900 RepID=A0A2Z6ML44_TRISU|nr:hypothetical protein TSUD_18930 [Trifolium subterraneum]